MTGGGDQLEQLQPRCPTCKRRHRPDLPCWLGAYRRKVTAAVLASQGTVCSLKLQVCTGVATTADHVLARSLGGSDDIEENLRPACLPCNKAKGNRRRLPAEPEHRVSGIGLSTRWRNLPG